MLAAGHNKKCRLSSMPLINLSLFKEVTERQRRVSYQPGVQCHLLKGKAPVRLCERSEAISFFTRRVWRSPRRCAPRDDESFAEFR